MVIFNYLIGNTDCHVKNFALVYSPALKSIRLAPAYDIISTVIYKESSRNMAFSIGGEYNIDKINADSFEKEANKVGIGSKIAMEHFFDMADRFQSALQNAVSELEKSGFANAADICEMIFARRSRAGL